MLLFLAILAYGLLIPKLGFYWDDFPLVWIINRLGWDGLQRYYSYDRPFLGVLTGLTSWFLGTTQPWLWHLFAIFWRWTATLAFWKLLRQLWPKLPQVALWAGIFFLLYPGFRQQWVSLAYGHYFLVLTLFFVSFNLNLWSLENSNPGSPKSVRMLAILAGLVFSWIHLIILDYFFFLEFIRPVFIWMKLDSKSLGGRSRLVRVIQNWFPFLLVLIAAIWTRSLFKHRYELVFFDRLRQDAIHALVDLVQAIWYCLYQALILAWGWAFHLPNPAIEGRKIWLGSIALIFLVIIVIVAYYLFNRRSLPVEQFQIRKGLTVASMGLLACLFAGWSIWLPDLRPAYTFAWDRFFLPFMPGAALFLAGVMVMLPLRRWIHWGLVAILAGLFVSWQFQTANQFRLTWELQQRFFWQLAWRAPQIEKGTLILTNEMPMVFYTDNSLTAPLNWMYAPQNSSAQMDYLLFYPSIRLGTTLPAIESNVPVSVDYRAASFSGSTSQMIALVYDPPGCLRVLDPQLDSVYRQLPGALQLAARISNPALIPAFETSQVELPPIRLFQPEPSQVSWCYDYQEASLARQRGDWQAVVDIGDRAYLLQDYPNDAIENALYIEAYGRVGNWSRALELSVFSLQATIQMEPVLCVLWQNLAESTPDHPEKEDAFKKTKLLWQCDSE